MKLTEKDMTFLEGLKRLTEARDLWVELRPGRPSHMVLRGTYGEHLHRVFHMSRQGVRWRFWRLFNDIYVSAFETILFIEKTFGTRLRDYAIRISRERYVLYQEVNSGCFQSADSLGATEAQQASQAETGKSTETGDGG